MTSDPDKLQRRGPRVRLIACDLDGTLLAPDGRMSARTIAAVRAAHDAGIRVGYWRAVSHNMNAFANETFIDECAAAAGKDPVAYRMALLDKHPRMISVLKQAADKSGWGTPAAAGRFRGVALMEGYDTYMAQVAEISMKDGVPVVHKVTVVADLGAMVNPDTVEAQIQSSVIFGLSAALWARSPSTRAACRSSTSVSYTHLTLPTSDLG